jgi:hypothetical protein
MALLAELSNRMDLASNWLAILIDFKEMGLKLESEVGLGEDQSMKLQALKDKGEHLCLVAELVLRRNGPRKRLPEAKDQCSTSLSLLHISKSLMKTWSPSLFLVLEIVL